MALTFKSYKTLSEFLHTAQWKADSSKKHRHIKLNFWRDEMLVKKNK
jgi:hypothetical protein